MLAEIAGAAAQTGVPLQYAMIGKSRDGREMFGLEIGDGPLHVSITAGAHSDEPVGPMTAANLALWLTSGEGGNFTDGFTWYICPQVNPDGAEMNRKWFADPIDPIHYFREAVRERPGDDIEFGYPDGGQQALRPENTAVAGYLRPRGPFVFHASLHGMAFAEGAWFLIGKEWADRTQSLHHTLAQLSAEHDFPLHDIDRRGDKGFTRIAPGFCTTPTSTAMREHFLQRGQADEADKFRPSSMEFVQSLGGDPLVMVSELPLFMISDPNPRPLGSPPDPGATAYEHFREALAPARAAFERGDQAPAARLMQQYGLQAVDIRKQVELQGRMILAALQFLKNQENLATA